MRKILNKRFYFYLVAVILIFGVLVWNHYSWWIALFNSIAVVIVGVLQYKPVQKINRYRKRYFPRWVQSLINTLLLLTMFNFGSHFSEITLLWFLVFAVVIVNLIFPELPEK
ncbi:hypothetical protein ACSU64_03215 [Bacillaceae bacterium C204]|uniref:hypothetical protein n=1 Tax=Neobacillus sp. 204 TaxID=3383351 RepID=UPI003978B2FB